jgi:hypothetical protein
MAITENEYTGNGSTVLYSFTFPYLEVADIKVSLDGTLTTAYTLANATTVQFNTAPANGVAIRLFRQTNDDALNAQFFPGSAIRSTDLNNNFTQNLYVTQESNRDATQGITTADAATATANTALSNSSAAVSTANTASSNASAAVSTANTASSNASAAVSTANTASSNATIAVSTANAATATANSAASDAATAISTANSAVSTANTASTTATNAVNTANSASSAASSAVSTANTASSNASAAVSTANTASSNATSAVNTANSALSTANAAASAVANAILYDIVANVAAIPASPANNDAVEVTDSTGIESFTPLTSIPGGFAGNSGLSVRIVYTTTGNTWTWIQYFPNDPETRYLKEAVTTSDTAPVSPSDGDLWYDSVGGRTYVYYDDGDSSQWVDTSPQGGGVSDAISEGDTSAEVIDTGSDGRFVVTTEGSERLRITSAGLVGIGTSSPGDQLTVYGNGANIRLQTAGTSLTNSIDYYEAANRRAFLKLDSSPGELQIGTVPAWATCFYTNNAERARIDASGRLGIGTSAPSTLLEIKQDQDANTRLRITNATNGSSATAGIHLAPYGGNWYLEALASASFDNPLRFTFDGTERFRFTYDGKLGIGTTTPQSPLTVGATTDFGAIVKISRTDANFNSGMLVLGNGNSTSNYVGVWRGDANSVTTGGQYLNLGGYDGIVFAAGASALGAQTERMRIDSSGRVGIGNNAPGDYNGGFNQLVVGSSGDQGISIVSGTSSNGTIAFADGATSTEEYRGYIQYGHASDALLFATGGTERFKCDSSGRLLVGTSSARGNFFNTTASAALQIEGTATARRASIISCEAASDTGGSLVLAHQRSGSVGGNTIVNNGDIVGRLSYQGNDGAEFVEAASINCEVDGNPGANDMPGRLVFSTTADGASSPTERMRITSNGTVGIGTTNPSDYMLGISAPGGKGGAQVTVSDTNRTPVVCANTATSGDNFLVGFFTDNFISRGSIDYNRSGGTVRYNTTSDARLKSNITDAAGAVNLLSAINVRSYVWAETGYKVDYGFVAQELHQVVPDAVKVGDSGEKVEDAWAVDYSKVVPVLTKALQEAIGRIETLEAANTDLAARLTALEGGTN